jgi:hypothetical protein
MRRFLSQPPHDISPFYAICALLTRKKEGCQTKQGNAKADGRTADAELQMAETKEGSSYSGVQGLKPSPSQNDLSRKKGGRSRN